MPTKNKAKPSPAAPTFGDRIRAARLAAGLTQVELAARMGIEQTKISRVERGHDNSSLERLHDFAVAIGCPPSELDERLRD